MPGPDVEKRLAKLEARVESLVSNLNDINKTAHDRIVGLEKKFAKLDKTSTKLTKATDPRATEKSISEVVDRALAAFDKAHKK